MLFDFDGHVLKSAVLCNVVAKLKLRNNSSQGGLTVLRIIELLLGRKGLGLNGLQLPLAF